MYTSEGRRRCVPRQGLQKKKCMEEALVEKMAAQLGKKKRLVVMDVPVEATRKYRAATQHATTESFMFSSRNTGDTQPLPWGTSSSDPVSRSDLKAMGAGAAIGAGARDGTGAESAWA